MRRNRSSTRSGTSSPRDKRARPDLPPVYIDASLSQTKLPAALRDAGVTVIASRGHTRDGAEDETWLDEAGRHGWIVLTKDKNIRYRPNELQALTAAGVGAFILSAANMTGDEQAALFVRLLRRMSELTAATARPFAFRIEKAGGIEPLTLRHAVDQRHQARRNR